MRILTKTAAVALACALPLAGSAPAQAQTAGYTAAGFSAYLPELRAQALREGVSRRTVEQIFPTLVFSARTIELDQAQPGGTAGSASTPPFAPYRQRHVNPALVSGGARRYANNLPRLQEIGRRYGVTPSVLVAIWGHETSYGAVTGDFDLLNSLATLSYEGRRRDLFSSEFIAALKMIDRGVPRSRLKGSWAGATGYPQFLPSVYLRVAADGDGDGHADIWQSQADALASIANYLSNAGWKPNTPWGVAVRVPAGFDRSALRARVTSPRCQRVHERHTRWMTIGEWRRMGIVLEGSAWPRDTELASLLEPDGPGQTAYLLTTNYRTILDYNCSNFYALSVGLLADAVSR
ncbi:lytic transglycosylase domain-containing protein [Sphingosinicella sp. BN140058]|uniref:lytic murein transglycosylase n=1 Tax=Sphingosinicella sp. BN140058 TaxID=1892855 RepID=UPI001012AC31|nr:lytic murein transglycosylase [Sphingosinicella sp. BN140058]QAY79341.1 lytic murein transglycosylase [Sphingosinicella sp. BN140058]